MYHNPNQGSRSSRHPTDHYDNTRLSKVGQVGGVLAIGALSPDRFLSVFKPYAWRGLNNPKAAKIASEVDLLAADREVGRELSQQLRSRKAVA